MMSKNDLKLIGGVIDDRLGKTFDKKLKPIKKQLESIEKKLDMTIHHFDRHFNYHHRRLDKLEEKAGVKPPDFLPKIN